MASPDTVNFYSEPKYEGNLKTYKLEDVKHLVLGTSYRSFHLGDATKLSVWNHSNGFKVHTWDEDQFEVPESSGMQCFKVIKGTSHIVRVRFKDTTGGKPKDFSLELKFANIGDFTLYSNESDDYAFAGVVPVDGSLATTAVYVRNEHSHIYVCTGSLYFKWDDEKQKVVILDEDNWPGKWLTHHDDGNNNFTITLFSTAP